MVKDRVSDIIEKKLIRGILEGRYPIHSNLQPERELAESFGVGRPSVREALQRLERDNWIEIRKGKAPFIKDYWKKGNLSTIVNIIHYTDDPPKEMLIYLLDWRISFSPVYVKEAISNNQVKVISLLSDLEKIEDSPKAFAEFDWNLQKQLAGLSQNPLYLLTLNTFDEIYVKIAASYYLNRSFREASLNYYYKLLKISLQGESKLSEDLVRQEMTDSLNRWRKIHLEEKEE